MPAAVRLRRYGAIVGAAFVGVTGGARAVRAQQDPKTFHDLGHAILREMIETNTTGSSGNTSVLAEQLATRLRLSGFPTADISVVGPTTKNMNLVVRYHGARNSTKKPILLLAHIDVVEAKKEDW